MAFHHFKIEKKRRKLSNIACEMRGKRIWFKGSQTKAGKNEKVVSSGSFCREGRKK